MKKTLIALALTALPVAAMADVVLYGQIKGGVGYSHGKELVSTPDHVDVHNDGSSTLHLETLSNSGSITQMQDYGSRIGFKGEEDLGNGLKAIWQVEQKVSLAGKAAGGSWNTRDTFIGLEGGFGKIRAGYVSDTFNSDMETMDIWEYSDNVLGLGTMTRNDGRHQGIRYDSPDFGGFSFNVLHQLADSATETTYDREDEVAGQATIVGLNYANSGFFGKLGYGFYKHTAERTNDQGVTETKDGHIVRVEGGYDANNLFVGLAYQYSKNMVGYSAYNNDELGSIASIVTADNTAANGYTEAKPFAEGTIADKAHEAAVSVAYTIGAVTPKITYAHGWDQTVGGLKVKNSGYDQVIIGADYALSKRTTALVSAGWMKSGATVDKIDVNNKGEVSGISLQDEDKYSVGVGLRHKF